MTEQSAAELVERRIGDGAALMEAMQAEECVAEIAAVAELVAGAYRDGGKVLLFGNGGSAADAVHIAAEFVGRYLVDRPPLPAVALVANISSVTAIGNDYGYDMIFERQVQALGRSGDVAIGLTTSGRSVNVAKGLAAAKELGIATVAMTGADPGSVGAAADHGIRIPSTDTPRIQEGHMLAAHTICEWVEARMIEEAARG
jgi:D-sedoheptulose 7-phosphate isomerase